MEEDTVDNSIIKISSDTDVANAKTLSYEIGSFKRTTNYNRILDNSELLLTTNNSEDVLDLVKAGSWIFVNDELKYIVSLYKKTRASNFGNTPVWKTSLELVSLTIILQKIILPNKTIRQPVVDSIPSKTVKGEMEKLVELYGSQYLGITNWVVDYPNEDEIVDEYTWTQPTLFECLCDLAADSNLTPRVTFDGENFVIGFVSITNDSGEQFDTSSVNGLEINGSLENTPQRMVNILTNSLSSSNVKESYVYLKSSIGVMDDLDSTAYISTAFKIEKPVKIVVKGNLSERYEDSGDIRSGHEAGYFEYDITDYVLEQSIFNSLETYYGTGFWQDEIKQYTNCNLYYILGEKNIYGVRTPYKVAWTIGDGIFSIINILNHISRYNKSKIITNIPTEGFFVDTPYFFNDDEDDFVYDLEYQAVDSVRYDIIKDEGYGAIVQNQSDAYVSFSNYKTQQQDIMNRLGSEEIILMGKVTGPNDLPAGGMLYGDKLIVQVTNIEYKNYYNFMCIATSKFNRVDSDAAINTKKRFFAIESAENSVERNEFFKCRELVPDTFNEAVEEANYFLLTTYDEDSNVIAKVYMSALKQKIDDKNYLFSTKALNNKYVSLQRTNDGETEYVKGALYVDTDTGEFDHATIKIVKITGNSIDFWKDFPQASDTLQNKSYGTITHAFKYKDSGEKIAFSVLYSLY